MKKLLFLLISTLVSVCAGQYQTSSFINGSLATLYTATGATTFKYDDAYATNRTYLNDAGVTVIPKATNSITGGIRASFEKPIQLWADGNAGTATNLAITVDFTANAFTNTFTFTIVRSADNGATYDLSNGAAFTFAASPFIGAGAVNAVLTTNIPTAFLSGASHLRVYKIAAAANPGGADAVIVTTFKLGGFTP